MRNYDLLKVRGEYSNGEFEECRRNIWLKNSFLLHLNLAHAIVWSSLIAKCIAIHAPLNGRAAHTCVWEESSDRRRRSFVAARPENVYYTMNRRADFPSSESNVCFTRKSMNTRFQILFSRHSIFSRKLLPRCSNEFWIYLMIILTRVLSLIRLESFFK